MSMNEPVTSYLPPGLNVLSLINEDSAAAVQFGISRQYNASEVHTVGFFNMGASSTSVTITRVHSIQLYTSDF